MTIVAEHRAGQRVATAPVESTINRLVNHRMITGKFASTAYSLDSLAAFRASDVPAD